MIEVRLFATFRQGREKIIYLEPDQYKSVAEILRYLDIPEKEVAILLINGRHSEPAHSVNDNDIVALFPPVGGG